MPKRLTGPGYYETPNVDYTPPKPKKPKVPKPKKPPKPKILKASKYGKVK